MTNKQRALPKITRREFLGLSALTGTAAILAACQRGGGAVETAVFTHGTYNPNWANTVLNELADEFGYFKEEGLTPEDIIIVEQPQIFPGLIGGSLNFAQQDTDAVAGASLAGEPIRFIATFRDKEPWIFGVGPGIETAEDLKGKVVSGGSAGGRNEFNGKEMLRRLGLDPEKDVEWQPVAGGSDTRVQAVIEGLIAGTVMFDRHRSLILDAGGKILHDDLELVPQDCFCVHENFLNANENTVVAFLKATTRARLFYHDLGNKDEIVSIMQSRGYEFPPAFIEEYDRAVAINSETGQFDIAAMEKLMDDALKTGSLEQPVDWRDIVRMDYLNQAYRDLGMDDKVVNYG